MANIPSFLKNRKKKNICIIGEGLEEELYLKKLINLNLFNNDLSIKIVNAKGNGNLLAKFQYEYQSCRSELIFIVCDTDKDTKKNYKDLILLINNQIFGDKKVAEKLVIYTNPCTLQVILYHFGDETLTSQGKKNKTTTKILKKYQLLESYDGHKDEINEILKKINRENYKNMKDRIINKNTDYNIRGNTNFIYLIDFLEKEDIDWVDQLNKTIK